MKPNRIAYELDYLDGSGIEHAVRFGRLHREGEPVIQFESVDKVDFPVEKLDWLIACLTKIKAEIDPSERQEERQ